MDRMPMTEIEGWHFQDSARVLSALGSDSKKGLREGEAALRLKTDGPNALPESAGTGKWKLFLSQFKSLVIWLLIAAGVISGAMGEAIDAAAILTIVLVNGIIGFYQEYNAEQSISALRKMTAPMARVVRDGAVRNLPASALVRGDIIELESGDMVPADARLFQVSGLRSMEAALTGESESVAKEPAALPPGSPPLGDRFNMAYMGTTVVAGAGRGVVVAIGLGTEIGKIARLLETAEPDASTPLQKRMDALSRTLVWVCLGLVGILFLLGLMRGWEPFELFLTAVSLAVAAAPEGLPAVVTVSLALGVQRMARRNALVRRLPSVETLGSATVICTDKTGTLTAGEMTVRAFYVGGEVFSVEGPGLEPIGAVHRNGLPPDPVQSDHLRGLAAIQSGTVTASLYQQEGKWKVAGDPTEGALIAAGRKVGLRAEDHDPEGRLFAYPFDSERKRASAIRGLEGRMARVQVNGAPDVLLGLCTRIHESGSPRPLLPEDRERILAANAAMASRGLRVIGSAYKDHALGTGGKPAVEDVERDLVFTGLAGMQDPPRPEARQAVAKCRAAGIRVVMITGDHPVTALAIAGDLGIASDGGQAVTGAELDDMDDDTLREIVGRIAVFARVSAAHKLRVIQAWKAQGAIVAMTGDGVNDAPALKGADIGVAMGRSGTEVTKQASDMIIADDNFASIVAAVEEGRGIFQNIRNTLQFLLAGNAGELLLMTVAIVAGLPAPLLPIHLLWVNLITDGLPALCLASERIDPEVMRRKPRRQSEILSDRSFLGSLFLTGLLTGGVSLAAFLWGLQAHGLEAARSAAFTTLVLAELLRSLGARSETRPLWKLDPRGNPRLLTVVAASIGLQIWMHGNAATGRVLKIVPFPGRDILAMLALASVPLLALEVLKVAKAAKRANRAKAA
jgi:P-type Ca2+ transporter type 2C